MIYYVLLDHNNLPIAWYNDDVFPPNSDGSQNNSIPVNAIVVSQSTYQDCMNNAGLRTIVNGVSTAYTPPVSPLVDSDVDAERDRRIYAGYRFQNEIYQTDADALTNLLGATQLAFMAIVKGTGTAGNLRWASATTDFEWIAADNTKVPLDAPTMVAFGESVAAYKSALTFAGRALKDAMAAGTKVNITTDASWGYALYGDALPTSEREQ